MPGPWQIALVVLLALLLFGRGKISGLMGDVAKGITSFRKGLKEGAEEEAAEPKSVEDKTIEGEATKVNTDIKEKSES
ncbi:twin-arginine translocase TatA/TatE family subunit [Kordiimonas sp. SCSIO 12603]|uniref:twin-arginine translocase TatA/TatE family subunit n=1 Tax=Kordiimonas sp. SCSIO 12603 TaxID=2829596 RepID=UPI0021064A8D|nr:twin-arginine translocase TatA/TatE family subunit [Kordiimonas sp. SCSIO 12603]UTW57685.1 twin-arginine translocase TatA/TatE family subunit [Kordiimonas sp. SCSIO 12603]